MFTNREGVCVLRRNQIFKDVLFEHSAQVHGPCEGGAEGKILKAGSVHVMKVHVCHTEKVSPTLVKGRGPFLDLNVIKITVQVRDALGMSVD